MNFCFLFLFLFIDYNSSKQRMNNMQTNQTNQTKYKQEFITFIA